MLPKSPTLVALTIADVKYFQQHPHEQDRDLDGSADRFRFDDEDVLDWFAGARVHTPVDGLNTHESEARKASLISGASAKRHHAHSESPESRKRVFAMPATAPVTSVVADAGPVRGMAQLDAIEASRNAMSTAQRVASHPPQPTDSRAQRRTTRGTTRIL
ncbi:hypothetical protein BC830DRAFT_1162723 [Chytriomyces sp. MP71]|nr:hypothetical protein BC830DRAFT_1162723 [Chytriomyces sp. MP71]